MRTDRVGDLKTVRTSVPSQSAQLDAAFRSFGTELQHRLIAHPSTRFFAYRTPTLQGVLLRRDKFGQALNGVVDIARTVDARYPVWCPIDVQAYRRALAQDADAETQAYLARQIVDLLCAVRSNILQGGPRDDEESSDDVVAHALPLLIEIVTDFLPSESPDSLRQNADLR
jgi:hypothetical protein